MNKEFNLLTTEEITEFADNPLALAVVQFKRERIVAQQKRRMNSYGRWSKIMRDKYKENN